MFNKKNLETTSINLQNLVEIKGYQPNPIVGNHYVVGCDKLYVAQVDGTKLSNGVRVAIANAEVIGEQAEALGDHVILLDKSAVRAAKNPFTRKEILALILAENARINGTTAPFTMLNDSISGVPDRANSLVIAGEVTGFKKARAGLNRQTKLIDRSTRPIVNQLHKTYKKSVKAAKKAAAKTDSQVVDFPVGDQPIADPT